jgi:hypothetical protein
MALFGKKSNKSGSYGYSKYDEDSRVIYSESTTKEGELLKHHYKYDSFGRRVYYESYTDNVLTLKEYTSYRGNDKHITRIFYNERVYTNLVINGMGRIVYTKEVDLNTNISYTSTYNNSTGLYDTVNTPELFVPCI